MALAYVKQIWILLLAAFPVMIAALYGLSRGVAKLSAVKDRVLKFCDRSDGFETMSEAFDYVVDVFFSRGMRLTDGIFPIWEFVIKFYNLQVHSVQARNWLFAWLLALGVSLVLCLSRPTAAFSFLISFHLIWNQLSNRFTTFPRFPVYKWLQ